ncbi:MAG: polysaccharide deacetylase family protein [Pseudomonadota bacterium]
MALANLLELLVYYRRYVIAIILAIPLLAFVFGTIQLHTSPVYVSTSKVNILPSDSELVFSNRAVRSSPLVPENVLSQTHIEYLTSTPIAQSTVDRLLAQQGLSPDNLGEGLAKAPSPVAIVKRTLRRTYNLLNSGRTAIVDAYSGAVSDIQESIQVQAIEGTYILEISVGWDDPETATTIANTLSEVYLEELQRQATAASGELEAVLRAEISRGLKSPTELQVLQEQIVNLRLAQSTARGSLRVIEPAVASDIPASPRVVQATALAGFAAVTLCLFAVVLLDAVSGVLRTDSQMRTIFGNRALGPVTGHQFLERLRLHDADWEITKRLRLWAEEGSDKISVIAFGSDTDSRIAEETLSMAVVNSASNLTDSTAAKFQTSSLGGTLESATSDVMAKADGTLVVAIRPGSARIEEVRTFVEDLEKKVGRKTFGLLLGEGDGGAVSRAKTEDGYLPVKLRHTIPRRPQRMKALVVFVLGLAVIAALIYLGHTYLYPMTALELSALSVALVIAWIVVANQWMIQPGGVPVLTYHSVSLAPDWLPWAKDISVHPLTFARHLKTLKSMKCSTMDTAEFVERRKSGKPIPANTIVLHFDDGYLDNWVAAKPLLERAGMRATLFVSLDFVEPEGPARPTTGTTDGRPVQWDGYLNWTEVRELDRGGLFNVQPHGVDHTRVVTGPKTVGRLTERNWKRHAWVQWSAMDGPKHDWFRSIEPEAVPLGTVVRQSEPALAARAWIDGQHETTATYTARVRGEFNQCKEGFQQRLSKEPDIFCWPHNRTNPTARSIAEAAGFVATTGGDGSNRPSEDPTVISRVHIGDRSLGFRWLWVEGLVLRATVRCFQGNFYWYVPLLLVSLWQRPFKAVSWATRLLQR